MRALLILTTVITLSACASKPPVWLGNERCKAMGCGKDLEFYPMAPGESSRNAKASGWDWGQTSSSKKPGTEEYKRLRKQEEAAGQTPWHWNN